MKKTKRKRDFKTYSYTEKIIEIGIQKAFKILQTIF